MTETPGLDAAEVAVRDLLESPTPRGVHYHTPRAIARAALTAAANAGPPALTDILDSELPMDPLTSEEQDTIGRAVSKGYAEPYEAYRLGMQEGITAAYVRFTTVAEEETPK